MAFWNNWFSNRTMIGDDPETQRLDQQRSQIDTTRAIVFGNQYKKKDISFNYNECYQYYYSVTSLNVSINKISQDCSKVKVTEMDSDIEITGIFDNTNTQIVRSSMTNLLLTGNIFVRVFGRVNQKVTKMQILDSRIIEFKDGNNSSNESSLNNDRFFVGTIKYSYDMISKTFIAQDELSYIYVIKNENNHTNYGISPLNNLLVKMDWLIEYEMRNTNNISTGINAHKIISPKENIGEDDMDNFESKYKQLGSRNGIMWTPFEIGAVVDISHNSTDLETYIKWEQSVYDVFHIPAPMLMSSNQTFNNFAEAIEQYTEEAIIPNLSLWKEGMDYILRLANPSFRGIDLKITKESITLQKQKLERMKLATETESLTVNEVREEGGFDDIGKGGDILNNTNGLV